MWEVYLSPEAQSTAQSRAVYYDVDLEEYSSSPYNGVESVEIA